MSVAMADKARLVAMVDEELRAALRLEASKRSAGRPGLPDVTQAEILEEMLREYLSDALAEVRKQRKGGKDH